MKTKRRFNDVKEFRDIFAAL